ncbi:hypothetical protein MTsPCn5_14790 [Croceitalea sp. MTPC5]|uniref:hypothetical protein n=1 Tax=Croceitalea sp. MTPC5 TaxID=3056565 RepID=UPI002B3C582A|nr:hypothetical protein MTsPCn5_14790 [Croceitalea sp. MTPC5]
MKTIYKALVNLVRTSEKTVTPITLNTIDCNNSTNLDYHCDAEKPFIPFTNY